MRNLTRSLPQTALLLSLLLLSPLTASTASANDAKVCLETGFFLHHVGQDLPAKGNCPGSDRPLRLEVMPGGLFLEGLGDNDPVLLEVMDDNTAKVKKGIKFFGKDHGATVTLEETEGIIRVDVQENKGPGQCSSLAVGADRCRYEVVDVVTNTDCNKLVETDIICGACKSPCPKLGKNGKKFVNVLVGGKPVQTCSVKLKRTRKSCSTCTGASFSVVE